MVVDRLCCEGGTQIEAWLVPTWNEPGWSGSDSLVSLEKMGANSSGASTGSRTNGDQVLVLLGELEHEDGPA